MKKIKEIYEALLELEREKEEGVSAIEVSEFLNIDRANVSRYLNQLHKEGKVIKVEGRPVIYRSKLNNVDKEEKNNSLEKMVGAKGSLQTPIQQAKAAILYPPRGLHTLILGETGVGKSMFAELMYTFAKESRMIEYDSPFIRFNCADYAENPQLLVSQIFGVKKGAYTGADSDKDGLLKKAHKGILFLDEIHRLSPQGQEMLFTFIDKGIFRPLGETEKTIEVDVQIIAATTEEPQSFLLKTFTRRIPMTITLPPLRERTLRERYELVSAFIIEESKRVGKSIYVNKNALISFLLYDCISNIGQLRSDIQLACAKSFLNYKSHNEDYIIITQTDIPHNVKKGIMLLKDKREEVNKVLNHKGDILKFPNSKEEEIVEIKNDYSDEDFYDLIEDKLKVLKNEGLEESEINQILNIDIEKHFKKYLGQLQKQFRKEEISKIIDSDIMEVVEQILSLAQYKLNIEYDEKVYFGLCLHLKGSIERIKNGHKIYHPKLNFIRVNYSKEFLMAMEVAQIIDEKFNIETPLDEIGYITMFLSAHPYTIEGEKSDNVAVIVIMHGNSSASSIVEVANTLVGSNHAIALDMPLSMSPKNMYERTKELAIRENRGKGVVFLVDMGSLTNFGDMIYEETGIETRTIDLVSTPIVIDICRKAVLGRELREICQPYSQRRYNPFVNEDINEIKSNKKKKLILSACFTGEGASVQVKEIIEKAIGRKEIEVKAIDILDSNLFKEKVNLLKNEYDIIAIVSTMEVKLDGIPFIWVGDLLTGKGMKRLTHIIGVKETYDKMRESLKEHIKSVDGEELLKDTGKLIVELEDKLRVTIEEEVKVGIVIHMCFLVDKLLSGGKQSVFENISEYKEQHKQAFEIIGKSLEKINKKYGISIHENEIGYLCRMFLANGIKH